MLDDKLGIDGNDGINGARKRPSVGNKYHAGRQQFENAAQLLPEVFRDQRIGR